MNVVILDGFLPTIRSIDIMIYILDKIAPFNTVDVREFASPNSGTGIANMFISGFEVEHVLSDDGKSVICMMCCATFGAAILLL